MSARTRIKICGIREPAHARLAADEGADAIGLNFWPASPRFVENARAAEIAAAVPPYVTIVGVFVDAQESAIRAVIEAVPLQLLQFQGEEPPEFCERFGRPYMRAVRMGPVVDLIEYAHRFRRAKALLLDAHVPGKPGGTGQTFDWAGIPREFPLPLVLSGGLNPQNVGRAVREVKPWAVDVASGVESSPGVKDPAKIVEFIRSVRREDGQSH